MLGEFEYLLIAAAVRLGDDAYGAAMREEIESVTRRRCSTGALYTTLDRLEAKGLLKTWMGEATPERGGRPKRMVRVTPKGKEAAADFYRAVTRVSRGVSWETRRLGVEPSMGVVSSITILSWIGVFLSSAVFSASGVSSAIGVFSAIGACL